MPDDAMNEQDSTGAATEPREPEAQDSAESPLDALRKEKDALHDRLLRTAAEFDNYRKRVDRDRRDQVDAATADAVVDFLPIVDDLERALKAPTGGDSEGFRKGVELIHQQMVDLLRKRGVRPIEAVGAEFDPRYHHRGYMLGDRLLRPAMVKVAKA
ncbi:MAG: nucleotide exchange factor GrpE [Acidobacteria bacterium]|nr:MAG: nucleotide exchange factor GrpE [Acidobacteriota bacterium]